MSDRDVIGDLVGQAGSLVREAYALAESSENPYARAALGVALAQQDLIRLSEARAAVERLR